MTGKNFKIYVAVMVLLLVAEMFFYGSFRGITEQSFIEILMAIGMGAFFLVIFVAIASVALWAALSLGFFIFTTVIDPETYKDKKDLTTEVYALLLAISMTIVISSPLYLLIYNLIIHR